MGIWEGIAKFLEEVWDEYRPVARHLVGNVFILGYAATVGFAIHQLCQAMPLLAPLEYLDVAFILAVFTVTAVKVILDSWNTPDRQNRQGSGGPPQGRRAAGGG